MGERIRTSGLLTCVPPGFKRLPSIKRRSFLPCLPVFCVCRNNYANHARVNCQLQITCDDDDHIRNVCQMECSGMSLHRDIRKSPLPSEGGGDECLVAQPVVRIRVFIMIVILFCILNGIGVALNNQLRIIREYIVRHACYASRNDYFF